MDNSKLFIEKLIETVKKNPILYDVTLSDYKNTFRKKLVWQEVAKEIGGKSGEAASWKWKNLRDSYAKHRKCFTSPNDVVGQRFLNWRWAPYMRFLDSHLRKPKDTLDVDPDDVEESNFDPDTNTTTVKRDSPVLGSQQDSSSSSFCSTSRRFETNNRKRRYVESPDEVIIESPYQDCASGEKLDKIDYLFLNYAETLKKLCPRRQALLKLRMAKMFAEAELEELQTDPIKLELQDEFD